MLALLLAACSGGSPAPAPTPTSTAPSSATPLPPPPTLTPGPTAAPTEEAAGRQQPRCPDPYPDGAPYRPEPGEPIRLRPSSQPPALAGYRPLPFATDPALERVARQALGPDIGRFAVVVKNLADGRGVRLAPDRVFYAASLFKTWVMLEAYHQREAGLLDFGERYVVTDFYAEEFAVAGGQLGACQRLTLAEAVQAMIRTSDNVAANFVLDRVGADNVDAALRSLGLRVSGFPGGGSLPTTANEMALLLEAIGRRQAIRPPVSDEMVALLATESFADRLVALLPPGTRVAHKTGNSSNATHDAGIVFSPRATYVIAVFSDFGFGDDGATPIARLSRAVYDYYNGR